MDSSENKYLCSNIKIPKNIIIITLRKTFTRTLVSKIKTKVSHQFKLSNKSEKATLLLLNYLNTYTLHNKHRNCQKEIIPIVRCKLEVISDMN